MQIKTVTAKKELVAKKYGFFSQNSGRQRVNKCI